MHYDIQRQVLWLQEETKEHMIQQFIESHIIEKKDCTMDEKDISFLWKSYLTKEGKLNIFQKNKIYLILFSNILKSNTINL